MASLRSALALPAVYRFFQWAVRGSHPRFYIREYIRPKEGDRVLDIGCGPGDFLAHLPTVEYHGLDLSPEYIEAAKSKWGSKGEFRCEAVADTAVRLPGYYDIALANGVLHHLEDAEAIRLFEVAKQSLKPGGRLITMDGCYTDASPIAKKLLKRDRGQFVRERDAYLKLAKTHFGNVESYLHHDLLRIPFSHLIMVCTNDG